MIVFLLIRHALTDAVGRSIAGRAPGLHLNDEGKRQAGELTERLSGATLEAIYSSPMERALETAEPLARALSIETQIRAGLNEIDFGAWTGCELKDLESEPQWQRFNSFRSNTRIPGGETMLEAQARLVRELEILRAQHPRGAVALVSHGDVIKAAVAHYAGIHLDLFQRIEISPASVSGVEINDDNPRILFVNDTGAPNDVVKGQR